MLSFNGRKLPKAHHIQLDPFVEPVVHPPRKVPAALREQVRAELDRMVNLGVIAKQDEPTDWVSSMVVVRKPGKLRENISRTVLQNTSGAELIPNGSLQ
jgi:hypothetical protein